MRIGSHVLHGALFFKKRKKNIALYEEVKSLSSEGKSITEVRDGGSRRPRLLISFFLESVI